MQFWIYSGYMGQQLVLCIHLYVEIVIFHIYVEKPQVNRF